MSETRATYTQLRLLAVTAGMVCIAAGPLRAYYTIWFDNEPNHAPDAETPDPPARIGGRVDEAGEECVTDDTGEAQRRARPPPV